MLPKKSSTPSLPEVESLTATVKRVVAMPKEAWPTGAHAASPAETARPPASDKDRTHLRIPAFGAEGSGVRARTDPREGVAITIEVCSQAVDIRSLVAARSIDAHEAQLLHRLADPAERRAVADELRKPEVARVVARLEARGLVSVRKA